MLSSSILVSLFCRTHASCYASARSWHRCEREPLPFPAVLCEHVPDHPLIACLLPPDIKEGKIVPVEITVKLLLAAMQKSETKKFLIDGFPRSLNNFEGWESVVGQQAEVAFCLVYECSEAELERRLLERGKSSGRDDDNIEAIKKRFRTFVEETSPVIEIFKDKGKLRIINSEQSIDDVWKETQSLFAGL